MQRLEDWLRSYKPEELFDAGGRLRAELMALAPQVKRRMSANGSGGSVQSLLQRRGVLESIAAGSLR